MADIISEKFFKPHPKVDKLRKELVDLYVVYDRYQSFEEDLLKMTHLQLYGDLLLKHVDAQYRYVRLRHKIHLLTEKIHQRETFTQIALENELDLYYRDERKFYKEKEEEIQLAKNTKNHLDDQNPSPFADLVPLYKKALLKLAPQELMTWYSDRSSYFLLLRVAFWKQDEDRLQFLSDVLDDEESVAECQAGLLDESLIGPLESEIENMRFEIKLIEKEYPVSMKDIMFDSIEAGDYEQNLIRQIKEFEQASSNLNKQYEFQMEKSSQLNLLLASDGDTGREFPPLMILAEADEGELIYSTHIAGTSYVADIHQKIEKLSSEEQLRLVLEPENLYDQHAVRVENLSGEKLGYIPKDDNIDIALRMASGEVLFARFESCHYHGSWPCVMILIYQK